MSITERSRSKGGKVFETKDIDRKRLESTDTKSTRDFKKALQENRLKKQIERHNKKTYTILVIGMIIFLGIIIMLLIYIDKSLKNEFLEECNYFDSMIYSFEDADLFISNERCSYKDDKIFVYFTLNIKNKMDSAIYWQLEECKISDNGIVYWNTIASIGPNIKNEINKSDTFDLYTLIKYNQDSISVIESGVIK